MDNRTNAFNGLLSSVNIVDIISRYISVEKKGQNYFALCPFHDDHSPSMVISPEKQIFNCFVCHTGGNAIRFVSLYEKINYFEAGRKVASLVNYKDEVFTKFVPERAVDNTLMPLIKAINDLTAYYEFNLVTSEGLSAKTYLEKRGISEAEQKRFRIGYAPSNGKATIEFLRSKGHSVKTLTDIGVLSGELEAPYDRNQGRVMFALLNSEGQVVGFSARTLSNDKSVAKYINSPETPLFNKSSLLYNYHYAKDLMIVPYVYLVEGFMDVIALNRAGIPSSVALMGTAFTKEQMSLLKKLNKEIRLLLDSDTPGQMATNTIIKQLMSANIAFQIIKPNEEKLDPDDMLQKYGKDVLKEKINTFISREDFIFNFYLAQEAATDIESKKKVAYDVINEVIINLKSRLEVSAFLDKLSEATGFNILVLNEMYEEMRKKKMANEKALKVVKTHLPMKKTLNRITQAERLIVYQMLHFPEARTFFEETVKVFSNDIHRYLANYIKEFSPDTPVTYSELLNDVEMRFSDEATVNEYTETLLGISEEAQKAELNYDLLDDASRIIMYERELKSLERSEEKALLGASNEEEYTALKISFIDQKKQLAKKYKRK